MVCMCEEYKVQSCNTGFVLSSSSTFTIYAHLNMEQFRLLFFISIRTRFFIVRVETFQTNNGGRERDLKVKRNFANFSPYKFLKACQINSTLITFKGYKVIIIIIGDKQKFLEMFGISLKVLVYSHIFVKSVFLFIDT